MKFCPECSCILYASPDMEITVDKCGDKVIKHIKHTLYMKCSFCTYKRVSPPCMFYSAPGDASLAPRGRMGGVADFANDPTLMCIEAECPICTHARACILKNPQKPEQIEPLLVCKACAYAWVPDLVQ